MCIFKNKAKKAAQTSAAQSQAQIDALIAQGNQQREDAAKAQAELVTSLTTGFNEQIATIQDTSKAQLDELKTQNTALTGMIGQQSEAFATSQSELLGQMNEQMAKNAKDMASALKLAQDQNAQAKKKPNYAKALQRNKELNSTGLSATMLTGPTGVAAGALPLGVTSLLGA